MRAKDQTFQGFQVLSILFHDRLLLPPQPGSSLWSCGRPRSEQTNSAQNSIGRLMAGLQMAELEAECWLCRAYGHSLVRAASWTHRAGVWMLCLYGRQAEREISISAEARAGLAHRSSKGLWIDDHHSVVCVQWHDAARMSKPDIVSQTLEWGPAETKIRSIRRCHLMRLICREVMAIRA